MDEDIKSGKQILDEFFSEIMDIDGIDKNTVAKLSSLYTDGKLTDTNIQNAMEQLYQEEIDATGGKDDKN